MICDKCGHKMTMHYERFCPKCNKDILIKKTRVVGDLFKIMYHMEANGYMNLDKFWREWFIDNHEFSNDSYIDFYLDDKFDNEELNVYMRKVAELLGVEVGDSVVMWISW